jgi:PhzF family phenazine biosynthesis protein
MARARRGATLQEFQTVAVFTADQFSGNPLAVVLNAEGLSTRRMQAIAAEFNLAETTFVLPRLRTILPASPPVALVLSSPK